MLSFVFTFPLSGTYFCFKADDGLKMSQRLCAVQFMKSELGQLWQKAAEMRMGWRREPSMSAAQ